MTEMTDCCVITSADDSQYLDFWPIVSDLWANHVGIEPVLAYLPGKRKPDNKHGQVLELSPSPLMSGAQAMQARTYAARFFPDKACIFTDIDMLPLYPPFFHDLAAYHKLLNKVRTSFICTGRFGPERERFTIGGYFIAYGAALSFVLGLPAQYHAFIKKLKRQGYGAADDDRYISAKAEEHDVPLCLYSMGEYGRRSAELKVGRVTVKYGAKTGQSIEDVKDGRMIDVHVPSYTAFERDREIYEACIRRHRNG